MIPWRVSHYWLLLVWLANERKLLIVMCGIMFVDVYKAMCCTITCCVRVLRPAYCVLRVACCVLRVACCVVMRRDAS